jgi:eukaryotic-like serine/threonine-protein kinase
MSNKMLGRLVKDRYKLIDELGKGSSAVVYVARDITDNHLYAAKTMYKQQLEHQGILRRFQREVAILQYLDDPHIVRIIDYGDDKDIFYIVMDYIDGKTLRDYMTPRVPLKLFQAFDYVRQIAEGLDTTYKKGVVHRDIKPQNILINRKGVVKIVDFGLALADAPTLTDSKDFMGTAYYVSPEQIDHAHSVDIRSDLYSLTVMFFEMVIGKPPYIANSLIDIISQHKNAPIPSVCSIRRELPGAIDEFISKGMAKAPADRFQTPTALLTALEQLQERVPNEPIVKMACLVLPTLGRSVPLTSAQMLVGRPARNLPPPDISLDDEKVGRKQACIRNQHGTFTVEDLKPTNPTRLNGVILPPYQEQVLKDGDVIFFGPVEARFEFR